MYCCCVTILLPGIVLRSQRRHFYSQKGLHIFHSIPFLVSWVPYSSCTCFNLLLSKLFGTSRPLALLSKYTPYLSQTMLTLRILSLPILHTENIAIECFDTSNEMLSVNELLCSVQTINGSHCHANIAGFKYNVGLFTYTSW